MLHQQSARARVNLTIITIHASNRDSILNEGEDDTLVVVWWFLVVVLVWCSSPLLQPSFLIILSDLRMRMIQIQMQCDNIFVNIPLVVELMLVGSPAIITLSHSLHTNNPQLHHGRHHYQHLHHHRQPHHLLPSRDLIWRLWKSCLDRPCQFW